MIIGALCTSVWWAVQANWRARFADRQGERRGPRGQLGLSPRDPKASLIRVQKGHMAMSRHWSRSTPRPQFLRLLAVCAGVIALGAASAQPTGPLRGEFRFHGETLVDPPPGEPPDTHLGLTLEGPVAKMLFQRLRATAERDLCLDDGSLTKVRGPLSCTELAGGQGWRCELAIDLETLALKPETVC